MNSYLILSEKQWHKSLLNELEKEFKSDSWHLIDNKVHFTFDEINQIKPNKIFIPHWSNIISKEIYENFECILFHMTDLPFGRGGSPLQNLIIRGFKTTKLSALKVQFGLDTGGIYLKKTLNLDGSATEIFNKSTILIKEMIIDIIKNNIKPKPQQGQVTEFKRRKSEESNIYNISNLEEIYDYIRMLDCEGYPSAFIETNEIRYEFVNAKYDKNKQLISANVRIIKK